MVAPTKDDLLEILRRTTPPEYHVPIEDDPKGSIALFRGIAFMFEQQALRGQRSVQANWFLSHALQTDLPASSAIKATSTVTLSRSRDLQFPVFMGTGEVVIQGPGGRQYSNVAPVEWLPFDATTQDVLFQCTVPGFVGNLEHLEHPVTLKVWDPTVFAFTNRSNDRTGTDGQLLKSGTQHAQLQDTGVPDVVSETDVGLYVKIERASVASNQGRVLRATGYEQPNIEAPPLSGLFPRRLTLDDTSQRTRILSLTLDVGGRNLVAGSNDRIVWATPGFSPASNVAFSWAVQLDAHSGGDAFSRVLSVGSAADASEALYVYVHTDGSIEILIERATTNLTWNSAAGAVALDAGFKSLVVTYDGAASSTTSFVVRLAGAVVARAGGSDGSGAAVAGAGSFMLGATVTAPTTNNLDGQLATPMMWSGVLGAADIATYEAGTLPRLIDQANRKFVPNLHSLDDEISSVTGVATGTGATVVVFDFTAAAQNATADDVSMVPMLAGVGDQVFLSGSLPYDQIELQIGTAGVGTWTLVWEYWNGAGWSALVNLDDGTAGFTRAGLQVVAHDPAPDWTILAGTFLVRVRVTAITAITTEPLVSQVHTFDQDPIVADPGPIVWAVLDWADLGFEIDDLTAPTGGRDDDLKLLANERGVEQQPNENDDTFRKRASRLADAVSPAAIRRAVNRVLGPLGLRGTAVDPGLNPVVADTSEGRAAAPSGGFTGFFWDRDFWDYFQTGDAFPTDPNLLLLGPDYRYFFWVLVPRLSLGEYGFAYDTKMVTSFDGGTTYLGSAWDSLFYDGRPFAAAGVYASIWSSVNAIRAGGIGFTLLQSDDL